MPESSSAALFFLTVATATPAKKRLAYERFIQRIESSYYKIIILETALIIDAVTYIREGFQYVRIHKKVLDICIFTCIINIAFVPVNVYQVPYVEDILRGSENMLSVMGVSSAIVMGTGAFLMPKWKEVLGREIAFSEEVS